MNERVSLFGEWKYGFLAMILVGAMNVGTIALNFDKVNLDLFYYLNNNNIGLIYKHYIKEKFCEKSFKKLF